MAEDRPDGGVRSVQFALDVLEAVAFADEEVGVTQLAERLGMTKGSVHRHLLTFVERGYVLQNPLTTRYGLGPRSRLLAHRAPEFDLARLAVGPMRDLRDRVGQAVVLSAGTPRGALVLSAVSGTSAIEIGVRSGSELSFHASGQGKILLAHAPRPQQQRILSRPLERFTPHSVVDPAAIEAELPGIVARGFATAPEEALLGVNAVAAPIFDGADVCVGALAIVGSVQFVPAEPDAVMIAALKQAAEQISRLLGHGQVQPPAEGWTARRRSA